MWVSWTVCWRQKLNKHNWIVFAFILVLEGYELLGVEVHEYNMNANEDMCASPTFSLPPGNICHRHDWVSCPCQPKNQPRQCGQHTSIKLHTSHHYAQEYAPVCPTRLPLLHTLCNCYACSKSRDHYESFGSLLLLYEISLSSRFPSLFQWFDRTTTARRRKA